jgi:Dolichyl-phosphate-mannose-protein mannosyltransferase
MKRAQAYWPLIMLLAIFKFVLPLFLQHPIYELQRDEYLYYQQGLHFDLGYLENPPLLSYLGMISSWFGGSVTWIKLWPCLFGAGTVVVTCLIAAELGGKLFAQFLAGLSVFTGAYMRVHFLFQPNFLDIFFWTLALYFIIRYINDNNSKFLYLFSISLALGFWGKYSVVFIIASILLALLASMHRKIFSKKKLYIAGLIGILIVLPNVWWQYSHRWPLVHHMEELQETQLKYMNPAGFLTDQLMMLIATAIIWVTGLVWTLRQKQWRFLGYTYFLVILLLILGRGKSYYSLGIYPMLLAAGAVAWERWTEKRHWIRYAVTILIIGFTYMILPMLLPIWKPEKLAAFYERVGMKNKWEDQKDHPLPQDFADMLGWKELTEKAEKFYQSLPEPTKSNTIIYCRNYGQAGALKYYGKENWFKALTISDNGSFILWVPGRLWMDNLIFIGGKIPDKDDEVFQHFEKVTMIDSVTNPYSRQFGDKIIFFEHIDSAGLQLARDGLAEEKKKFQR